MGRAETMAEHSTFWLFLEKSPLFWGNAVILKIF